MSEIVDFNLAKKLKEKGFSEKCLGYYSKDSEFYYNICYGSDVESAFASFNSQPHLLYGKRIDAPTISEVLKWLREKHNILVSPSVYGNEDGRKWNYAIVDIETFELLNPVLTSNLASFEEAAIAGIERVLDNLI